VFPGRTLYIEYSTQKIAETFPSSEEEKRQLFHLRDTLKQLLLGTQRQAREKSTTLYKAVAEGTYGVKGIDCMSQTGRGCMQRSARHEVKVIGGRAEFDVDRGSKKLLRIKITAEVDGVKSDYTITCGRFGTNAALGFAVARADAPRGR